MQGKGAGPVNLVELESQVLCAALRQSFHLKDKIGSFTAMRELSHLFPDLLPPPEKDDEFSNSNKSDYYQSLGIKPQSTANGVVSAYLRNVKHYLRTGKIKDHKLEYNNILNAAFVLRKPRLRLSHDLVVSRRWLHDESRKAQIAQQEITIDHTLSAKAIQDALAANPIQVRPAVDPHETPTTPMPVFPVGGHSTPAKGQPPAPAVASSEVAASRPGAPVPPLPPVIANAVEHGSTELQFATKPQESHTVVPPVPPLLAKFYDPSTYQGIVPVAPAAEENAVSSAPAAEPQAVAPPNYTPEPQVAMPETAPMQVQPPEIPQSQPQPAPAYVPPPPLPAVQAAQEAPSAPAISTSQEPFAPVLEPMPAAPTVPQGLGSVVGQAESYQTTIDIPPAVAAATSVPVQPQAHQQAQPQAHQQPQPQAHQQAPVPAQSSSATGERSFVFDESALRKPQPQASSGVPTVIHLLEAAQIIGPLEVQALVAQMAFAPNVPVERLILNAGYVTRQELSSVKLGESLLQQGRITLAQFQVAIYDERTSGLRMAESLQVRGWLSVEVRNAIDEWQRKRS